VNDLLRSPEPSPRGPRGVVLRLRDGTGPPRVRAVPAGAEVIQAEATRAERRAARQNSVLPVVATALRSDYAAQLLPIMAQQRMQTFRLDPRTDASTYDRVVPTVRGALAALGLRDGVFHMELFHQVETDAVWFSECAARRGGGLIHEEIDIKFSVDLGDAALRLAAGLTPEIEPAVRPGVVGATFLPLEEGILLECPTAEDLLCRPSVEYARIELPIGFHMRGSVSDTIGRVGQVLLRAPTLPAFLAASHDAVAWFCERMTVLPTTLSPAELRDRQVVQLDGRLDEIASLAAVA
jgi:hypothetical protein